MDIISDVYVQIIAATSNMPGRYKSCIETWASHFSHVLISGDSKIEDTVPHIIATDNKTWRSCPTKLFRGMEAIAKDPQGCKWAFLADDDTFVNWINLKALTSQLSEDELVMYGRNMTTAFKFNDWNVPFLSGGGGTLISMKALKKIIQKAKQLDWMRWLARESAACLKWKFEGDIPDDTGADVKLGYMAQVVDVKQYNGAKLFHECGLGMHKKPPEDILESITYHRAHPKIMKNFYDILLNNKDKCSIERGKINFIG